MKATEFDFAKDLKYNIDTGMTMFKDSRLVIFDTNAIGYLRNKLIQELGWSKAREFFIKFSFQNGYADFMQMKINYTFENEFELLASGPVIHTWEGVVKATPTEIKFDRDKGDFYFTGVWENSYEAEQHLSYTDQAKEPVCWSLMGYASGWCSAFFGSKVIAIEPVCVGKGDNNCGWLIQPPSAWDDSAQPYIDACEEFQIGGK